MVVLFGVWFLGWSGTLFLSSTRMIFAAAFDRVLPDHAAQVSERRAVPIIALLYIMVPAVVVSVIYAYSSDFRALTLDATLVIAVTFLGSCDRGDDPAVVQAEDLRQLAGRPPEDRHQRRRADHLDHPGLDDRPVAQGPAVRDRRRQRQLDHLPRRRLRRRGDRVHRGAARPAEPGRRPRRDPLGDPGGVAAARDRPAGTRRRRLGPRGAFRFSPRTSRSVRAACSARCASPRDTRRGRTARARDRCPTA